MGGCVCIIERKKEKRKRVKEGEVKVNQLLTVAAALTTMQFLNELNTPTV